MRQEANANSPVIWGNPYPLVLGRGGIRIQKSDTSTSCNAAAAGAIRYNAGTFQACNGTAWASLFSGSSFTGQITTTQVIETVVAGGTCATAYNVNPTNGSMVNLTLNGTCAIGVTALATGHSFLIKLTQSSTVAPTFTAAYKWPAATAPTWSTSATKYDMIACASLDGSTLQCNGLIDVR